MAEKNPRDMLNKASWTLMEGMKDTVTQNVTQALRGNQLAIDPKEVPKLLAIIAASLEEGYHKGFRSFDRVIVSATGGPSDAVATKKNAGRP